MRPSSGRLSKAPAKFRELSKEWLFSLKALPCVEFLATMRSSSRQLHGFTLILLLAAPALGQTAPPPEPTETQGVEVQNLSSGSEGVQAVAAFQASIKRNEPTFARRARAHPRPRSWRRS